MFYFDKVVDIEIIIEDLCSRERGTGISREGQMLRFEYSQIRTSVIIIF